MADSIHAHDRNAVLDLLKFIFALMIVLYHSKAFAGQEQFVMTGGYIAVDFFFIAAGCFLAASAASPAVSGSGKTAAVGKDTFDYILRRLRRFYPEFIIGSLIALVAKTAVLHWSAKEIVINVIRSAGEWTFLQQAGFDTDNLIGATWFLSAMILASALLFPLARKFQKGFFYLGAPLIFIFLFGITYSSLPHLQSPKELFMGVVCIGLVRAIMELSAGCFIYILVSEIKRRHWNNGVRLIFTILEPACFGAVIIYYASGKHYGKEDWYAILVLILGILVTQSDLSCFAGIIHGKFFEFLGRFSFDLYLGHRFWSVLMDQMTVSADMSYGQKLMLYLALSFGTALLISVGGRVLRRIFDQFAVWACSGIKNQKEGQS